MADIEHENAADDPIPRLNGIYEYIFIFVYEFKRK